MWAGCIVELLIDDFTLTLAPTLSQAAKVLELYRPDLIILDLGLPDSERHETTGRMAGVTTVPIVACSSCTEREAPALRARVRAAGAVDLLVKGETDGVSWGTPEGKGALVGALKAWINGVAQPAPEDDEVTRILLVEDEGWMVDILRGAVAEAVKGAYCDVAGDIAGAVQRLRTLKYRLVILDLNISGSSGLSTLETVAHHVGLEHVLVVTGATELEDDVSARKVPFLAKPFKRADLVAAINRAVSSRPPAVSLLGLLRAAYVDLDRAVNQPRPAR